MMQASGHFNYIGHVEGEPLYYVDQHERTTLEFDAHDMPVHDIREFAVAPTLEREGFMAAKLPLDLKGERDIDAISAIYRPLMHDYMAELTGAKKIIVLRPMLRWSDLAPRPDVINSHPARYVHCDWDNATFRNRAEALLADDPDRDHWLSGRFACVQTWRALSAPPQDLPLAVIDRQSLVDEDKVHFTNVIGKPGDEARFGNFAFRHNPDHRWAYISDMEADDMLVFMGFDTAEAGKTGSPHSAFDYYRQREGTVPRHSCELRAFVFYG
ncbi:CmcJ/NvfI family oxidoreductase [Sphingobium tyrosinilyticum]|uniref:CmcJ/NvfI family oxidoreductase n=1 Tax=Sphingobium tyrosinilyticum TaxID=2715436 RepID=A0ABV9F407_9SPHN